MRVTVSVERMREICTECEAAVLDEFHRTRASWIAEWRNRWFNRMIAKITGAPSDEYVVEALRNEFVFDVLWPSPILGHAREILSGIEDTSKSTVEIDARDLAALKAWCRP